MDEKKYLVQRSTPFSESIIWSLNINYYQQKGIGAWSEGEVPHYITSNSTVGKTYSELIFALLCDLADMGKVDKNVYILELGAGHGRLCFHILYHLNKRIKGHHKLLPEYTYILTDIVEENLTFFKNHTQFQKYFKNKTLDVAYYDGRYTDNIHLHFADKFIEKDSQDQPMVVIANYFFDSIPFELVRIKEGELANSFVTVKSTVKDLNPENIPLNEIELQYQFETIDKTDFEDTYYNDIIDEYVVAIANTYLPFPKGSLDCIKRLHGLSKCGMMLLTMDKGFQHLSLLNNRPLPEWITHGSFSFSVNYHAFIRFCELSGGKAMFSNFSNFHLEVGCLLFMENNSSFSNVHEAFRLHVDDFGPDDFYNIINYGCENAQTLKVEEIIVLLRMSSFDSTVFENLIGSIKKSKDVISMVERERLKQTFEKVLEVLFNIGELDIAFEMGGLLYDFGFFNEAIVFFEHSALYFGHSEDSYYNIALSYFQLNKDLKCKEIITESNRAFPMFVKINELIGMM